MLSEQISQKQNGMKNENEMIKINELTIMEMMITNYDFPKCFDSL